MATQEKSKSQVKSSGTFMLIIGCALAVMSIYLLYQGQGMGGATMLIAIISIGVGIKGISKAKKMPDS